MAQTAALNTKGLPLRVVFQDEARFGRLSDPRRCWAPAPIRPLVKVALVREYTYAYAAVTPKDGDLVWMLTAKMDTPSMNAFVEHVCRRYPDEYVLMVLDGASSHRSQDLQLPENMALVRLPAYSPELNPAERLWEELREKEFANRVFESLGAAIAQAARGLQRLQSHPEYLQSLTGWNWILGSS